MLENFQLAAIVKSGRQPHLLRIPLHQNLQDTLAENWFDQYRTLTEEVDEVDFNAGYRPEEHERFRLPGFQLPEWLNNEDSETIPQLDPISEHEDAMGSIKAIVGFAQDNGEELILFQNFTRSHVIHPGRFLFLSKDTYVSRKRPGLILESRLVAVYFADDKKLLFQSFRATNTFLPLTHFYEEATENDIRQILQHDLFAPADVDIIVENANTQWFRKRFAMLRDSGILEEYNAQQIIRHSQGYDVDIQTDNGRIVFPPEKAAAKRLLQFLNEELFRGAITDTLYETNSKKEAD